VSSGKPLDADQRTLVAQNRQDGHQKHPPLREADATAHAAIRQRLEKADQIASGGGFRRKGWQGCSAVPAHDTEAAASDPGLLGQTSDRPWEPAGSSNWSAVAYVAASFSARSTISSPPCAPVQKHCCSWCVSGGESKTSGTSLATPSSVKTLTTTATEMACKCLPCSERWLSMCCVATDFAPFALA